MGGGRHGSPARLLRPSRHGRGVVPLARSKKPARYRHFHRHARRSPGLGPPLRPSRPEDRLRPHDRLLLPLRLPLGLRALLHLVHRPAHADWLRRRRGPPGGLRHVLRVPSYEEQGQAPCLPRSFLGPRHRLRGRSSLAHRPALRLARPFRLLGLAGLPLVRSSKRSARVARVISSPRAGPSRRVPSSNASRRSTARACPRASSSCTATQGPPSSTSAQRGRGARAGPTSSRRGCGGRPSSSGSYGS